MARRPSAALPGVECASDALEASRQVRVGGVPLSKHPRHPHSVSVLRANKSNELSGSSFEPMSGDSALPIFFLGLILLVTSVTLANNTFDTVSWWPTLLYVPAVLFVLVGQLWFLGAFAEQPEASPAALMMFVLICVLPPAITLGSMWGTEYDFMKWSSAVLLAPALLLPLLSLWPDRWTPQATEEDIEATREAIRKEAKRKLPG